MEIRQTEEKITALYERLSRDDELVGDSTPSSIKRATWRIMLPITALRTASTTMTTDTPEPPLTAPHGNG